MRITFIAAAGLALGACAMQPLPQPEPVAMTAPLDLSTPEATAFSMMRAMYQGDADMVDAVFLDGATLRRVTPEGEVQPDGLKRWRDWVGTLAVGDAHETLFAVKTEQRGNLASVWAPFTITFKGKLVGCGVNQLSMARIGDDWRVVFGMDTGEPDGMCEGFRARYLGE